MQIKKFEAPTIQEALENVKRELGPEAIILQTKKNKKGLGLMSKASVEVTAAVSERSLQRKQIVDSRLPDEKKLNIKNLPATKQAEIYDKYMSKHLEHAMETQDRVELKNKRITATRYIDIDDGNSRENVKDSGRKNTQKPPLAPPAQHLGQQTGQQISQMSVQPESPKQHQVIESLEEELRSLKQMLNDLKSHQKEMQDHLGTGAVNGGLSSTLDHPILQDVFDQLVIHGVDRRYAYSLLKKAAFEFDSKITKPEQVFDQIATEMLASLKVESPLAHFRNLKQQGRERPFLVALIGPSGVGKTTTLAKLASEAQFKNALKVGLINLDQYKLTSFEQLGTYSKILNVPFRNAASNEDLNAVLSDFQNLDIILIDTPGRSHRDPAALKEIQDTFKLLPGISSYLVLSNTTRDAEMYESVNYFSALQPKGLIISKLDESVAFGGIYNVAMKSKLPLAYFTTGHKIPDDIEDATPERVVSLVLEL